MDKRADLHVHTKYSDGTFSESEVVDHALSIGLGAIAITDHDCIDGVEPVIKAAKNKDIDIIPGIEISSAIYDVEIHILGYFVDISNAALVDKLKIIRLNRIERIKEIAGLLNEAGLNISAEKVLADSPDGTIGRPHLARMLLRNGYVSSMQEAFNKYLADGKPCHVKHRRLEYTDAINLIKKAGGVPVLAHPGFSGLDKYIDEFVDAGIMGIEVYYPDHAPWQIKRYESLCSEKNLIMTGGSDCHGKKKGAPIMGKITVSLDVVESLRKCS